MIKILETDRRFLDKIHQLNDGTRLLIWSVKDKVSGEKHDSLMEAYKLLSSQKAKLLMWRATNGASINSNDEIKNALNKMIKAMQTMNSVCPDERCSQLESIITTYLVTFELTI